MALPIASCAKFNKAGNRNGISNKHVSKSPAQAKTTGLDETSPVGARKNHTKTARNKTTVNNVPAPVSCIRNNH